MNIKQMCAQHIKNMERAKQIQMLIREYEDSLDYDDTCWYEYVYGDIEITYNPFRLVLSEHEYDHLGEPIRGTSEKHLKISKRLFEQGTDDEILDWWKDFTKIARFSRKEMEQISKLRVLYEMDYNTIRKALAYFETNPGMKSYNGF